ncbi:hypothetical protein ACWDV4_06700 [Micromonospora sp. NPDC003197]
MILLVPANPLRPRRPDDHFVAEVEAARAAGLSIALIDHDAVVRGDAARAVAAVPRGDRALYRGWMLNSMQYDSL